MSARKVIDSTVTWGCVSRALVGVLLGLGGAATMPVNAANHLDTPTVIADPRADIGDVFAWMSDDGKQVHVVMTIVGHTFAEEFAYTFHVDSGKRFGKTTATTTIRCHFDGMQVVDCGIDKVDRALGDPSNENGLMSLKGRFRVYAGLRDDPFFNNVRGFRAGYDIAIEAMRGQVKRDAAGCPQFDGDLSQRVLSSFRQTNGGPAQNFLVGWTPAALVLSLDRDVVARGGDLLAIWAATVGPQGQLDRMGRPLTENALLATLGPAERANALKERFNATTPAAFEEFVPEVEQGLAVYDGFDASCGDQLLADRSGSPARRYRKLARVLADDRLWVNSATASCEQFFAVELAALAGRKDLANDCGGRTLMDDSLDVYRSLLVNGTTHGIEDGVAHDDQQHSSTEFPFLAPVASPSGGSH